MQPSFETLIEQLNRDVDSVAVHWAAKELLADHSKRVSEFLPKLLEMAAQEPWFGDTVFEDAFTIEVPDSLAGQAESLRQIATSCRGGAVLAALRWLGRWEGAGARAELEKFLEKPEGEADADLVRQGGAVAGLLETGDAGAIESALEVVRAHRDRDGKPIVDWALALVDVHSPDAALAEAAHLFRRLEGAEEATQQARLLAGLTRTQRAWSAFHDVAERKRGVDFRRLVKANAPGVFEGDILEEISDDVDRGELGRSAGVVVDALRKKTVPTPRESASRSQILTARLLAIFLAEDLDWNQAAGHVRRELVSLLFGWWTAASRAAQETVDPSSLSFDDIFWELRTPKLASTLDDEALREHAQSFTSEEREKLGELLAGDSDLGIAEGRLWNVFGATRQPEALEQILSTIRGEGDSIHAAWFSALDAYGEGALPAARELILDSSLAHPIRALSFAVLTHVGSDEEIVDFVVEHFTALEGELTDDLLRWIEHRPSAKFLAPLADLFRPGESEIAWVGLIHCELFDGDPALEKRFLKALQQKQRREAERAQKLNENPMGYFDEIPLRLRCTECQRAYTYDIHLILLDLNALDQEELRISHLARIQTRVKCKGCKAIDRYELTWSAEESLRNLMTQALGLLPRLQTPRLGALVFVVIQSERFPGERPTVETLTTKLRELVEERPSDTRLIMELTRQLLAIREFDESLACVDRLLELEPEAAEPYFVRGTIHERFDRYAEAHEAFQAAYDRLESGKDLGESPAAMARALTSHLPDTAASLGKAIKNDVLKRLEEISTRRSMIVTADDVPTELAAELAGGGGGGGDAVSRNALCPCGSGKKFKACHGQA